MALAPFLEPLEYVGVDAQMHEVLPLGITTRARFQKSSPTAGASGALARVLLAPHAAFLLIALREYLTAVFFCVTAGLMIHKCVHTIKIHQRERPDSFITITP